MCGVITPERDTGSVLVGGNPTNVKQQLSSHDEHVHTKKALVIEHMTRIMPVACALLPQ